MSVTNRGTCATLGTSSGDLKSLSYRYTPVWALCTPNGRVHSKARAVKPHEPPTLMNAVCVCIQGRYGPLHESSPDLITKLPSKSHQLHNVQVPRKHENSSQFFTTHL